MDAQEFDRLRDAALRLCRAAAREALPIEEMLAYIRAEIGEEAEAVEEHEALEALEMILEAVGNVAAIGKVLPAEDVALYRPFGEPATDSIPLPSNLKL